MGRGGDEVVERDGGGEGEAEAEHRVIDSGGGGA
jgi:hypothetical protein